MLESVTAEHIAGASDPVAAYRALQGYAEDNKKGAEKHYGAGEKADRIKSGTDHQLRNMLAEAVRLLVLRSRLKELAALVDEALKHTSNTTAVLLTLFCLVLGACAPGEVEDLPGPTMPVAVRQFQILEATSHGLKAKLLGYDGEPTGVLSVDVGMEAKGLHWGEVENNWSADLVTTDGGSRGSGKSENGAVTIYGPAGIQDRTYSDLKHLDISTVGRPVPFSLTGGAAPRVVGTGTVGIIGRGPRTGLDADTCNSLEWEWIEWCEEEAAISPAAYEGCEATCIAAYFLCRLTPENPPDPPIGTLQ